MRETDFLNINGRARALMEQTASSANLRLQQQVEILRVGNVYRTCISVIWLQHNASELKRNSTQKIWFSTCEVFYLSIAMVPFISHYEKAVQGSLIFLAPDWDQAGHIPWCNRWASSNCMELCVCIHHTFAERTSHASYRICLAYSYSINELNN